MFENSTVCHSRRISLFCPVTMACASLFGGEVWLWWWFLWLKTIISDNIFCQCCVFCQGMWLSFSRAGQWLVWVFVFDGEFDPGSGRTLAACLTHASRAERPLRWYSSGERVSNT